MKIMEDFIPSYATNAVIPAKAGIQMSLTDSVALFDLGTTVLREQFELIFLEKRRFYQKEAHIWIPAFAHCCPV